MKKILSKSLAFLLTLSITFGSVTVFANPSSWAETEVTNAISLGIVPTSLQSDYHTSITREQFCSLVVASYESINGEILDRSTFNDTDNIDVEKASSIGVVNGTGNGNFSPYDLLNREQAATMLTRLADSLGFILDEVDPEFNDNSSISSWATQSVGAVQNAGIMGGVGNNNFSPSGAYTIEQSIMTCVRLYNFIVQTDLFEVIRVVDGDTIIINYYGEEQRVRLIGIDTPESVHPDSSLNGEEGVLASDFTKNLLEGKYVSIELDVQEYDIYNRLLAYIYLDGVMINKTLLETGYAVIATYPPNVKYLDDFNAIMGVTTEDTSIPSANEDNFMYVGSIESNKYHFTYCRYASIILEENLIRFLDAETAENYQYSPCGVCH